jgi:hypothetical protein
VSRVILWEEGAVGEGWDQNGAELNWKACLPDVGGELALRCL